MPLRPGRCVPEHLHEALLEAALLSLSYPQSLKDVGERKLISSVR